MQKWIGLLFSVVTILSFSGCSNGSNGTPVLAQPASGPVTVAGIVHGGQQPVSGSVIQLWAVGASGYGSAPTGLISAGNQAISGVALTDANGHFNITGTYTCPTGTTQVYLTSTGGNPGLGGANSAINLMYAIGNCNSLTGSTFIFVNEVSTVAAVYSLAQFMDPASGNVGYYSASSTGIKNAFSVPSTMFSSTTGLAYTNTPGIGAAVPQQEIHSLANILGACVNSSGPGSPACSRLFSDTTIGSSAPSNTLTAILSIALHPANNVSDLFTNVGGGFAQFAPALSSAPNDFTVALSYNSGAAAPSGLAIDTSGALWIADYGSTGGSSSQWVRRTVTGNGAFSGTAFSNTGTFGLHGVGIDANGSTWGISQDNKTVTKFLSNGSVQNGPYNVGNSPRAIAFDLNNNAWVTNSTDNSVSVLSSLGSLVTTATGGGLNAPRDIAIDSNGFAWVANHGSSEISSFSLSGSTATARAASGFSGGGLGTPKAVAVDGSSNIWIGSNASSTVISEFNNAGTPVSSSGYSGGGTNATSAIAFDGSGNIWSGNQTGVLSELDPTGTAITPSTGYQAVALAGTPNFIAIDLSGNIWVTTGTTTSVNGVSSNLVQFLGAATPVIQPTALALKNGQLNQRPGTPIPIVITSSYLPYYNPSTAYQARIVATGGNTGSYTFTLASGSLPSGITLASNGVLSGTSSASGTSSFTVQATDSTYSYNYNTKAFTLTASSSLPAGANNSELSGSYAVQLSGLKGGNTSSSGAVTGWGSVGSLAFDGNGNFTGTMDYNGATTAASLQISVSGTYSVGSDNRGTLLITSASSSGYLPTQLSFSVGGVSGGVAQIFRMQEFDWTGVGSGVMGIANGVGKQQTAATFTSGTIGQTFVFGADGESPCNTCSGTVSPFGSISVAGRFVNSGGSTTGQEDAAAIGATYSSVSLSGSYTTPDGTYGRGTLTLTPATSVFPAAPTHYVYYIVNASEIFFLSTDGHTTTSLLNGDALVQSGTFSNATLSGSYISYDAEAYNGDGTSFYPNQQNIQVLALNFSGTGTVTVLKDQNKGGTLTNENNLGGAVLPYSVDANGRLTLNGGSSGIPVFYLANSSTAFGTEAPGSGQSTGMYTVEKQSTGPFSCSTLSGTYFFGNTRTVTQVATNTGTLTFSSGSASTTGDNSDPSGVLTFGTAATDTCASDSYTSTFGRIAFTSNGGSPSVAYIISPSKAIILDNTSGKTVPGMTVLQK